MLFFAAFAVVLDKLPPFSYSHNQCEESKLSIASAPRDVLSFHQNLFICVLKRIMVVCQLTKIAADARRRQEYYVFSTKQGAVHSLKQCRLYSFYLLVTLLLQFVMYHVFSHIIRILCCKVVVGMVTDHTISYHANNNMGASTFNKVIFIMLSTQ